MRARNTIHYAHFKIKCTFDVGIRMVSQEHCNRELGGENIVAEHRGSFYWYTLNDPGIDGEEVVTSHA